MKVRIGLFQGKNIVNVYLPGDGEAFSVITFLEIAEIIYPAGFTEDDCEFFYID